MINGEELNTEEDVVNLLTKINNMKSSLVDNVIRQHGKFENLEMEISELAASFDSIHLETENIIEKCSKVSETLFISIEDREKYQKQISSLKTMKEIVMDLIILNKHICNLQVFIAQGVLLNCENLDMISEELNAVNIKLKAASKVRLQELKAYNTLLISLANIKRDLTTNIECIWEANILINRNAINPFFDYPHASSYPEFIPYCKTIEITVSSAVLKSLINLMCYMDIGSLKCSLLLRFITSEMIYPAIENFSTFGLLVKSNENHLTITSAAKPNKDKNNTNAEIVSDFIKDLTDTLKCLSDYFLYISISDQNATIIELFHNEYFDVVMSDSLISFFLNEISIENSVLVEVQQLISFLEDYKFISSAKQVLMDFIDSSDLRTRNNNVTNLLNEARKLYSKSIIDFQIIRGDPISSNFDQEEFFDNISDEICHLKLIDLEKYLFPVCKVSSSVVSSINIIVETIHMFECAISSTVSDSMLQDIADFLRVLPDMIIMYLYVIPLTNKEVLDKLPLASVLHYNNCMYISHYCLYWTAEIKPLIDTLKSHSMTQLSNTDDVLYKMAPSNLLSLVYRFRNVAVECITEECNKQKLIISEFFDEVSTFRGIGTENREKISKIVKKCCCQLSLLSNIYNGFPETIFDHVYGSLIDWTTDQILENVLSLTDIVQVDNEQLTILINDFKDQLVKILIKSRECLNDDNEEELSNSAVNIDLANSFLFNKCCKWRKLQELLFVLENGLLAIEERWINPDSKMSDYISAGEVRNLIRALFKNSHIRSKVIDKII